MDISRKGVAGGTSHAVGGGEIAYFRGNSCSRLWWRLSGPTWLSRKYGRLSAPVHVSHLVARYIVPSSPVLFFPSRTASQMSHDAPPSQYPFDQPGVAQQPPVKVSPP